MICCHVDVPGRRDRPFGCGRDHRLDLLDQHGQLRPGVGVICQQVLESHRPLMRQISPYALQLGGSGSVELLARRVELPLRPRVRLAAAEQPGDLLSHVLPRVSYCNSHQRVARQRG